MSDLTKFKAWLLFALWPVFLVQACGEATQVRLHIKGQVDGSPMYVPGLINKLDVVVDMGDDNPWTHHFELDGTRRLLDESLVLLPPADHNAALNITIRAFFDDDQRAQGQVKAYFVEGSLVDKDLLLTWLDTVCVDPDGDSYGGGGLCTGLDCDESNVQVHAGAEEICDGIDNDCDALVDNNLVAPHCVLEQGVCASATQSCGGQAGWLACVVEDYGSNYERQEQSCDGLDNDCDGLVDNISAEFAPRCPLTLGVCATSRQECAGEAGWKSCTIANYGAGYQADELDCDGLDNDCDGDTDEGVDCPPCQGNADCGDGNSCTDDICVDGLCRFQRREAGSICNDGEFCRTNDRCDESGYCFGVLDSPCTQICNTVCNEQADRCDPDVAGTACPGNNTFCDGVEVCDSFGRCASPGSPCAESDCQHCHEDAQSCLDPPGTACTDDGLFCTGNESCDDAGHCVASGDPCSESDCQHCQEDSDSCFDPSGTDCSSDDIFCNGDEQCDGAGQCSLHTGNPCKPESQCKSCQENSGTCFVSEGASCDDEDMCSVGDYCDGRGSCLAGLVQKDVDGDSHVDLACGGDDCDDEDDTVPAVEGPSCDLLATCFDGKDNDCNGDIDFADTQCQADGYFCLYGPKSGRVSVASGSYLHIYLDPDTQESAPVDPARIICFTEADRLISPTLIHRTDFSQQGAWTTEIGGSAHGRLFLGVEANQDYAELGGDISLVSPTLDTTGYARLLLRVTMDNESLDEDEFDFVAFRSNANPSWTYLNLVGNNRGLTGKQDFAQFLPVEALDKANLQIAFVQVNTTSDWDASRIWNFELLGLSNPTQQYIIQQNHFEFGEGNESSSCTADVIVGFTENDDAGICLDPLAQYPDGPGRVGVSIQPGDSLLSPLAPVGWIPDGTLLELGLAYAVNSGAANDYARMSWEKMGSTQINQRLSAAIQGQGYIMHRDVLQWREPQDLQDQAQINFRGPAIGIDSADHSSLDDYSLIWTQASHDLIGPFAQDSLRPDLFSAAISTDLVSSTHVHCVYLDENGSLPVLATDSDAMSASQISCSKPLAIDFVQ